MQDFLSRAKDADSLLAGLQRRLLFNLMGACSGRILLIGISYDKKTRQHECVIEVADKKS